MERNDVDMQCYECHVMYYSGDGHPKFAMCRDCWMPQARVGAELKIAAIIIHVLCDIIQKRDNDKHVAQGEVDNALAFVERITKGR